MEMAQLPRNSMRGTTGSQSQRFWKSRESKSPLWKLREYSAGKVPAIPVRGAVFDPSYPHKGLDAGTHLLSSPGEAEDPLGLMAS